MVEKWRFLPRTMVMLTISQGKNAAKIWQRRPNVNFEGILPGKSNRCPKVFGMKHQSTACTFTNRITQLCVCVCECVCVCVCVREFLFRSKQKPILLENCDFYVVYELSFCELNGKILQKTESGNFFRCNFSSTSWKKYSYWAQPGSVMEITPITSINIGKTRNWNSFWSKTIGLLNFIRRSMSTVPLVKNNLY